MRHDLVVIVPGIMGTSLLHEGRDVWNLTPEALAGLLRPSKLRRRLMLQEGIEDGDPEGESALTPGDTIEAPRVLPGLVSHLGYRDLLKGLDIQPPERLAVFRYDWRLSNRNSAEKLRAFVERRLARWRERIDRDRHPDADDPKVVFLCRSMGGLVVKYYLECLGGREITRTVATLGTPHQGSAKAIRFLTGRFGHGTPRWISESLAEICGSFPSLGQLLPSYRAVVTESPRPRPLNATGIADALSLPTATVEDMFRFHEQIRNARSRNDQAEKPGYRLVPLGGHGLRTVHGVSVVGDRIRFLHAFDDTRDWQGDSTVPTISATPAELESTVYTHWFPFRHATLANEGPVLAALREICQSVEVRKYLASDAEFAVDLPDLAVAGEPMEITTPDADPALALRARLLSPDGRQTLADEPLQPDGQGGLRCELRAPAGLWTLEVRSRKHGVGHRDAVLVTGADAAASVSP
ncbi:esterase/lipase family protein [Streptomyces sp. S465]|uniref:esterase/lipase family protein n=1 Tax=Streptomyces sp. S465 TaxID=2979468 RepID=UPI0022A8C8EC|nr:hypothetical protein [Streptomyces sp. S465]WAP60223.1 hypothetical protein N6H00_37600 [Streptomyces sp. S465]